MVTRLMGNQSQSVMKTRIAQIVSNCTDPIGITDRNQLEEIANEAIRRLEGILPGMESLIMRVLKKCLK